MDKEIMGQYWVSKNIARRWSLTTQYPNPAITAQQAPAGDGNPGGQRL